MNQSGGSSVQTEIFPPENIKNIGLYTKYTQRYIADMTLFCYVLGTSVSSSIPVDISDPTKVDNVDVSIKNLTFGHIKKLIWPYDNKASELKLWRIEISREEKKERLGALNKYFRENVDMTDVLGEELDATDPFPVDYKPPPQTIHLIAQPPPPATTVSPIPSNKLKSEIKNKVLETFPHVNLFLIDQLVDVLALIWHDGELESGPPDPQSDPCFKLKMEPSFFKINLPRGITKKSSETVDLCLPSYDNSRMNYHNPFYKDPQFMETVSLVQEKIKKNPGDVIVLAGVSGGGKTSTAFEIATQRWSIYIDFSPSMGVYGDHAGAELENIRIIKPSFEHEDQQSRAFRMLDIVILLRGLLLIKMLTEEKISTPKEWLFVQLQMDDRKFRKILDSKLDYDARTIPILFEIINSCLKVDDYLTLIFDEAQVLCRRDYGDYKGSTDSNKKWNLLQAYIEHLTRFFVTCLIAGTYMHMASGMSLVTSIGKAEGLHVHIVIKLPFLSQNDVLRNLDAVIDLTDVTPKTRNCLGHILKGRPRNCASFIRKLILERESKNRTKDQEIQELLRLWFGKISSDMAVYLENACIYPRANRFNPETAIMDVLRLRVFYDHKYEDAIKLLQHSVIPCKSPDCITLKRVNDSSYKIKINTSLESYLVSGIELFLLNREKTLVDIFIDDISRLKNVSSIGSEFDAVFITAMIQKRGRNVREELNKWKNRQEFNLPSWITPTMRFMTISNLSGSVPIAEYIDNPTYYRSYGIQPDRFSGSDVVISFADDEQNVVLLSASCTISGKPINRSKIKEQVFKSCMKFQYMEKMRKRKRQDSQIEDHKKEFSWKKEECLEMGLGEIPDNEEDNPEEEEEKEYDQDFNHDDLNYDLKYIENTEGYQVSRVPKHADNHEEIKSSTENRKHIYVSVELPHRASKRPKLFRFNEYGDLVIIVDDRNMEYVFGPAIKGLVERISYQENQENAMNQEDLMDQTE